MKIPIVFYYLAIIISFVLGVIILFFLKFADDIIWLFSGKDFFLGYRFAEWYEDVFVFKS